MPCRYHSCVHHGVMGLKDRYVGQGKGCLTLATRQHRRFELSVRN